MKVSILLNVSLHICPLTFVAEVLRLVAKDSPSVAHLSPLWQGLTTCCVTKATPNNTQKHRHVCMYVCMYVCALCVCVCVRE